MDTNISKNADTINNKIYLNNWGDYWSSFRPAIKETMINCKIKKFYHLKHLSTRYRNTIFFLDLDANRDDLVRGLLEQQDHSYLLKQNNFLFVILHDFWNWGVQPGKKCLHNELIALLLKNKCPSIYTLIPGIDTDDFVNLYTGKSLSSEYLSKFGPQNVFNPSDFNRVLPYTIWFSEVEGYRPLDKPRIKKILISGVIHSNAYPERYKLSITKNPAIVIAKYDKTANRNRYSDLLSSYLCCFASSVYDFRESTMLHKYYEILGAGSLLLVPTVDNIKLTKIGLISGIHYLAMDMSTDDKISDCISYIVDDKNRQAIDNIRKTGQDFCKKHFTKDKAVNLFSSITRGVTPLGA